MSGRLERVKDWASLAKQAGYTVSGVARSLDCTPRHLRRHIAQRFGMTAEHWLQGQRLRRAASGLLRGENVKSASAHAGYPHPSSLAHAFQRFYGKAPSTFSRPAEAESPYNAIGQLLTAFGYEADGSVRLHERFGCTYDGNLVLQERHFASQLSTTVPQQAITYTRGRDLSGTLQGAGGIGGLLARTDGSLLALGDERAHAYYHADGNGNITALTDARQLMAARYLYDPYGNLLAAGGRLAEWNLYRFSSKELHGGSGLVYYLYRYYHPTMQRWPNRDPIGERGGMNLYGFVKNAPVGQTDRFGLSFQDGTWNPGGPGGMPPGAAAGAWQYCCNSAAGQTARLMAKLAGIQGDDTLHGGNAFLHCLATCGAAKACGMEAARDFWTAHEGKDLNSQTDLINNESGYQLSGQESCYDACMESWNSGSLTYHDDETMFPCPPHAPRR